MDIINVGVGGAQTLRCFANSINFLWAPHTIKLTLGIKSAGHPE